MPVWWYSCWLIRLIVFQRGGHCISHELGPAAPSEIPLSISVSLLSAWECDCTWTLSDGPLWLMIDFWSYYILFLKMVNEINIFNYMPKKIVASTRQQIQIKMSRYANANACDTNIILHTDNRYHWYIILNIKLDIRCQLLLFHFPIFTLNWLVVDFIGSGSYFKYMPR